MELNNGHRQTKDRGVNQKIFEFVEQWNGMKICTKDEGIINT